MELYSANIRIIYITVGFLLYVVGISGNSLIIWTFIRIKRLRIVQNVFVILLAVVDLLIIGYMLPNATIALIWNRKPVSREVCIFNAIIGHLLFTSCLQYITCIAVSRYVRICHSKKFDRIYTQRNVSLICIFCFLYWCISVFPLLSLKKPLIFEKDMHVCIFNRFENKIYTNLYTTFCLIIPIGLTAFCYIKIYIYVRTAKLKMYKKWNNGLARQRILHELIVTRCQFAIFAAYLIFYLPFGISTTIGFISGIDISWLNTFGMYLGFANSCINSILYGAMNRNIKQAYFESLCCLNKNKHVRIHIADKASSTLSSCV